jgi:hypothetical protein
VGSNNDFGHLAASLCPKRPLTALNSSDCFVEGQFPGFSVVYATDRMDALMGIRAVSFVHALDFNSICHFKTSLRSMGAD